MTTPDPADDPEVQFHTAMTAFETTSRVGPDGRLHLSVPPELANTDVKVTVEPAATANGARPARRTMSQDEWRTFIDRFAGSLPDFPDIERPGPDAYEDRGDWA